MGGYMKMYLLNLPTYSKHALQFGMLCMYVCIAFVLVVAGHFIRCDWYALGLGLGQVNF